MKLSEASILVVDDNELNRDLLSRHLRRQGYAVAVAENGREGLDKIQEQSFDLVLLDIMMPEMNGYQVLEHLKEDPELRHLPVIVISAVSDLDSVVRCIELGAEEYLMKPFNRVLLRARISAALERKYLRDQEQAYLMQLEAEQEKSERLLLNVLPKPIADRLKQGQSTIADRFEVVSVLFADIVNFTRFWSQKEPDDLVRMLNELFSSFDHLAEQHGLEKIKTIGDAYMVVGGLPTPRPDHAETVAAMALDLQEEVTRFNQEHGESIQIRIGIDSGPVVAGVIGQNKFIYDLWGDTVNIAYRMESQGLPGRIQVTENTQKLLQETYLLEERGTISVKGKGEMLTFFLIAKKN
jgi:class 3 adenylate cyclase